MIKLNFLVFLVLALNVNGQNKQAKKEKSKTEDIQLINTDKEPKLKSKKFVSLFNGENLEGWTTQQGTMKFEANNGEIVGTCSEGPSTFLCTEKEYVNFI